MATAGDASNQILQSAPDGPISPIRSVLLISAAVFAADGFFMLAFPMLIPLLDSAGTAPLWGVAILDATLMAAVAGIIAYFWVPRS
jgi:hypothetical protein